MRLITNQELLAVAGGTDEPMQTVEIVGHRELGTTSSGGLTGGG